MSHIFNRLKKDLYVQYEREITAVVEDMTEETALSPEEQELQQHVPQHLRVSYPRQQLLCLRAAKVTGGDDAAPPPPAPPRTWDVKAAEQLQWEADLEKVMAERQARYREDNLQLLQMHRLQGEAVRKLRQSILDQEDYRQQREQRHKEEEAAGAAASSTETASPPPSSTAGCGTTNVVDTTHRENLEIIREGGRAGAAFTDQRMHILEKLDRQLQEEKLAEKVGQM